MRCRAGWLLLLLLITRPALADGTGTVRGTVRLNGLPPPPRLVDMRADPACPRIPVLDDEVILGPNGGLANVYVAVESLDVHPNWFDLQQESAKQPLDATIAGCQLHPRVMVDLFARPFRVKNSDAVAHDLLALNELQMWIGAGETAERADLSVPGMMRLGSDLHPWIRGAVAKAENPLYALSGRDGAYVIANVPPGSYPLVFIHERYGEQRVKVTVTAGGTTTVDQTFVPGKERPEVHEACTLLPDRDVAPPRGRPASAATLRASRKISDPIARGRLPGDEELGDDERKRLALVQLLDAIDAEPANAGARVTLVELGIEAYDSVPGVCGDPAGQSHDRITLHRWVVSAIGQLAPAVQAGCAGCMKLVNRLDDGALSGLLAGAPDVQAAVDTLRAGPQTPVAAATRAVIAALELSATGEGDRRAWAKAARHVDESVPIKVNIHYGGADPPDDHGSVTLTGRKALARWAGKTFDPMMGNGGAIDGDLACSGRCCDLHHAGSNIMRADLERVCFDAALRLVSMAVDEGGP